MTAPPFEPLRFQPPAVPERGGYVFGPELVRAVRVALATARPLLLRGAPGSGKTTLARSVAALLGADYYQEVVTSRTEARDLEWRFDAILRLAETQIEAKRGRVEQAANYVEPKALWWGFDPESALGRGGGADTQAADPLRGRGGSSPDRNAVVLIDEIDKAEPEVANDLLEPFDVKQFTVAESGAVVTAARQVFLVVTTNEERDLPSAFLRRCVVHELRPPAAKLLARIAQSHFGTALDDAGVAAMIGRLQELADEAAPLRLRAPGTAEFLDALRATRALEAAAPDSDEWKAITRLAMWKHRRPESDADAAAESAE
jgi:MoxR-like ATPase